ncbi:MAG: type II toxin-antitoxin system VapB family antitoxin [Patulibacter sp.]|nr:type II toxin-antitoxin system VapB family antitoxin [Patulibacter sp.]
MIRTSISLDPDVVQDAREALGTKTTAETVRVALDEVLKREARKAVWKLETDMTLEDLWRMRGHGSGSPG